MATFNGKLYVEEYYFETAIDNIDWTDFTAYNCAFKLSEILTYGAHNCTTRDFYITTAKGTIKTPNASGMKEFLEWVNCVTERGYAETDDLIKALYDIEAPIALIAAVLNNGPKGKRDRFEL